ncbi:MAG: C-GCAxxG-C-C family protein, partial [Clostridia bacterium]
MDKQTQAENYFKEGYNCCQAVVLAFADEVKVDKDTLLMIASSFGGGMGRLREVCGAVSAMFIIEGLKDGYTLP